MDIKNMTAGQIADMTLEQFNSLNAAEARQALAKVRRSVNQRLRRLGDLEYSTPAVEAMKKANDSDIARLPHAGKTRNENLALLKQGIDFLNNKTAIKKGAERHFSDTIKNLGLPENTDKDTLKQAYKDFHKAQSEYGGMLSKESGAERYEALKRRIAKWSSKGMSSEKINANIGKFYKLAEKNEQLLVDDILDSIENVPKQDTKQ